MIKSFSSSKEESLLPLMLIGEASRPFISPAEPSLRNEDWLLKLLRLLEEDDRMNDFEDFDELLIDELCSLLCSFSELDVVPSPGEDLCCITLVFILDLVSPCLIFLINDRLVSLMSLSFWSLLFSMSEPSLL